VFVEIITELKTCHIYKVVLLTIKVAACNTSGAANDPTNQAINNIIQ
jgi:hypothetical protein